MSAAPITLVCGFGRCGSSMVMQMLRAGGMPVTGEWPDFETILGIANGSVSALEDSYNAGRATKILEPHKVAPKLRPGGYRSIWLDRDVEQQAKSLMKLLEVGENRRNRRALSRSLLIDRAQALKALNRLGPVLELRFEDILLLPRASALAMAEFCELPESAIDAMAAAVRPRSPMCAMGRDLEADLVEQGAPE